MHKDVRHDGSFIAVDDDGNNYVIHIYTNINEAGTSKEPHATEEGLKSLMTDDGKSVNYLEQGKYKIVQTGVVVRSDDPDAP